MVYLSVFMNRVVFYVSWFLLPSLLAGCFSTNDQRIPGEKNIVEIELKYASGFSITQQDDYTILTVHRPYQEAQQPLIYVLYPKGTNKPEIPGDAYIQIPIEHIVCTSTTHIPLLDYLGVSDALAGFPTLDYISSKPMRERIDKGEIMELGTDAAINLEKLISLAPDLVMAYSMTSDFGQFNRMKDADIDVVINAEYLEEHPLGRAEWIKFMGVLFDRSTEADSVFSLIEESYNSTKALTKNISNRPTVMSGIVYGDSWFLPGGQNYAAKLFKDAGLAYIWAHDSTSGFMPLSFETVYDIAGKSDLWIGVGSYNSLTEIDDADNRYTEFHPFELSQVYSFNKRMGAKGGSEYLELGYLRPDLILKDLVKIGHEDLLPAHELYFFFQLPEE